MNSSSTPTTTSPAERLIGPLGILLVVIGMVHTLPTLPGLDEWVRELVGNQSLTIRRFPFQYLNPLVFVLMMTIVLIMLVLIINVQMEEVKFIKLIN